MSFPRLQLRLLGLILLTTVGLVTALYLPLRAALLDRVLQMEAAQLQVDLERVHEALGAELGALQIVANDYGLWDDSYAFIAEPNAAYIASNFGGTSLQADRLSLVALVDERGEEVWSGAYDLSADQLTDPPWIGEVIDDVLGPEHAPARVQGLVRTHQGLTMFAGAPIFPTDGSGPARGTVLMGRRLDDTEIGRLSNTTRLELTLWPLTETPPSPDFLDAKKALVDDALVVPLSEEQVAGYTMLRSIPGEPLAVVRIVQGRALYRSGLNDARVLLQVLGLAGAAFGLMTLLGVQVLVVRRVLRLEREVLEVAAAADHTARVTIDGHDEITLLADGINGMLASLELLTTEVQTERGKAESLLLNILPEPIADRLKDGEGTIADDYAHVSVLFADLVGFTRLAGELEPRALVQLLNALFTTFDALAEQHAAEKIKTIGDAYMVVAGLPAPVAQPAVALTEMALGMHAAVQAFNQEHGTELAIRIGIHTGPVVAGVIGRRKFIYDLWGDTVNVASRMESTGLAGAVQVTPETAAELAGRFHLERRTVDVKGKGEMTTYLVTPLPEETE